MLDGKRLRPALALPLFGLLAWLAALLYAQSRPGLWVDETVHVPQIQDFLRGHFVANGLLTTIPGYHLLMAGILKLLHADAVSSMRAVNAVLGLLPGLLFYGIRRTLGDAHALRQAMALFFFPLLFPYDFLIYTDVLSLALLLGAMLAALHRRHIVAALVLTAAVLVRQNNVIWAGFVPLLMLWPALQEADWRPWRQWQAMVQVALPYALPAGVFVAYWAWNGSISLSKAVAGAHPDLRFHPGNIYFALFLFVLLFPHACWIGLQRFAGTLRAKPWLLAIPLLAIAFLKLRGSPDNRAFTDYFLRNALIALVHDGWLRHLFALLVAMAGCSIAFTRFILPQGWLIYPFAALYLGASWLIENRYAILPIVLWMALRQADSDRVERCALLYWIALSLFFVGGIFSGMFML